MKFFVKNGLLSGSITPKRYVPGKNSLRKGTPTGSFGGHNEPDRPKA